MNPLTALLLVAALGVTTGCAVFGAGSDADADRIRSDAAGDEPVPGMVRIARVDRASLATDGTVRYFLDNVSGEDQEHLTARVIFFYPPTSQRDIEVPVDIDVAEERSIALFSGQTEFEFEASSRTFDERSADGDAVLATRIEVAVEELVQTVARDDVSRGSRFLNGRLECVGVSPWEERSGIDGATPRLWLEFENVTQQPVTNIEVRVVFFDGEENIQKVETGWSKLGSVAPGARGRVEVDLTGVDLTKVRQWRFLVRTRQSSGLFG